ncbi:TRAP transporter small permease [Pendulispora brunnea]|uniref:TRAP transporter small permease n=1 Tax=Pendulispora brunnea TaxID=2905690 RepID=A0ABZ2K395_9BACT
MDEKKDLPQAEVERVEHVEHVENGVGPEMVPAPASHPVAPPGLPKQPWGAPLVRVDKVWTRFESRLCAWVLVAEILALCIWIFLKGMAAGYSGGEDKSGLVLRALVGAVLFGLIAHKALKPKDAGGGSGTVKDEPYRAAAGGVGDVSLKADAAAIRRYSVGTTAAVVAGLLVSRAWANFGAEYCSNLLNWLQSASTLTLIGGLRGVATRLTLWLALLGASLATAQGKHINVDVVMRFLTPKLRVPVAVLGWLAAALMCFAGVWGFFDNIAIVDFHAPVTEPCPEDPARTCDVPAGKRIAHVEKELGTDLFLLGRQISLDFKSLPKVLGGKNYNDYLGANEWNEWLAGSSWKEHYPPDAVDTMRMTEGTRAPLISIPGAAESAQDLLVKDINFIFPFGLLMIGLRFILRALLALSGHVRVDPDAAHGEEEVEETQLEKHGLPPSAEKGVSS